MARIDGSLGIIFWQLHDLGLRRRRSLTAGVMRIWLTWTGLSAGFGGVFRT